DQLGLAQLYQIRGRVGRSDVTAHAYLFYPDARELTGEARARLATLADHTELGAGFAIAMRDLEIRGAGELLGAEQSGHVAAVGFELYVELLNEAEAKLKLARLGADYLVFRGGKATVGRLVLGSEELRELRSRIHTAVYTVASREVALRSEKGFPQAIGLVDAILEARQAA